MQPVNYRNLDEIREQNDRTSGSRWIVVALFAIGCGAVVTATAVGVGKRGEARTSQQDPLAELVAKTHSRGAAADQLDHQLGFPSVLSDQQKPTTALAAVKDPQGRLIAAPSAGVAMEPAPINSSSLVGTPMAAGDLLRATAVTTQPRDELTRMALNASKPTES
ncbi:MAG TPA: hypothetical protein VIV60_27295, partial [Polyangiaceae bacterium]